MGRSPGLGMEPASLEGEEEEEGHHEAEEPHGLGEGEAEDGVGEQLLLQGGVPGVSDDEGAKDGADSSARSRNAHSGGASSDELGSGVDVGLGGRGGEELARLHGGGPGAPEGGQGEAGGEGEAGDGGHPGWGWNSLVEVNQAIKAWFTSTRDLL